jgi:hypothetical protein
MGTSVLVAIGIARFVPGVILPVGGDCGAGPYLMLGAPLAMIPFTPDSLEFADSTTIIERWWLNA